MKKICLIAGAILISLLCPAQKKNVAKARSLSLQENPNFAEARNAIQEALENEETQALAETWYVAGLIGYEENKRYAIQATLGQKVDPEKAGEAVLESYSYWLVADSLSQIPTYDKKGRPKYDTRIRKEIQKRLLEYYKAQYLISYGIYLNEQSDYEKAYEVFELYLTTPDLPMMQEPKLQEQMPKDTIYNQYTYYLALFAIQGEDHDNAIRILEDIKDGSYQSLTCYQLLYQEYFALKDTAEYVAVLQAASDKFPQEPWFLQNLINHYIFSGQQQAAMDYLKEAIEREPNVAQYHLIMGNLQETTKQYEVAEASFNRALELNPQLADAVAGKGRIIYNQAVQINEDATAISDAKAYKKALEEMNEMFKKSLPFFEKAHEMDPENRDYMTTLKSLYYRFKMTSEYDAMTEKLNQ